LKTADWTEVDLAPLRARRDAFVAAVRGLGGVLQQEAVRRFVDTLAAIQLVIDPNRKPTPSPRTAGWTEELTDAGLGLTATWKAGPRTVKLDFAVVQPEDPALAPFYLAKRALAVGEFIDLMNTRPDDAAEVMKEMPAWAKGASLTKPDDQPMSWRPNLETGRPELNPTWFHFQTPLAKGLFDDDETLARTPVLAQAKAEKPTARSPLQHIPPGAAKILVERMLGARLPTVAEWDALMKTATPPATGIFRGESFQKLFGFLRDYNVAGITQTWRPNTGAFRIMTPPPGGGLPVAAPDDGRASDKATGNRLWFAPVDEGPTTATGGFVNLTGNVWIYLQGERPDQFYAAGGSILAPPDLDLTKAYRIEVRGVIGARKVTEGFADVGVRPAFDAPPGFKERYQFLVLVRNQPYLTW
jgi:hypothetical protein